MKKLTPTKSIKVHCKWFCMNGNNINCESRECVLRRKKPSPLKRIKEFCKECAADFKPKQCDVKVLNTPETASLICPFHPYRLGRNPNLKGRGNLANLKPFVKNAPQNDVLNAQNRKMGSGQGLDMGKK